MARKLDFTRVREMRLPIATKLILSFLLIIAIISIVFIVAGIQLIGTRVVEEAQERVRLDLNSAREIYLSRLGRTNDVVRLTADKFLLKDALLSGKAQQATEVLTQVAHKEGLDLLTVTDRTGIVFARGTNPGYAGDDKSQDDLVSRVLGLRYAVAVMATSIVSAQDLQRESPALVGQAYFKFIDTPRARVRPETEETSGMMLKAAAPVLDDQGNLIGVLYGGVLLNRDFEIVDKIKQTVFQDVQYDGKELGTATIFQDDVRISTNVRNLDGLRAVGTRAAEDVYNQVVKTGKPWIGRAFVVNAWYIAAYEPIRNINDDIVGILYVGVLEQKYGDIRTQTVLIFLAITLVGVLVSIAFAYFMSRRISDAVKELVSASHEIARGNLGVRAEVKSHDELRDLADTFNVMALALKDRDDKLKEFTTKKIMESERLALIGQLAANVAHELNNPLQGIVTYARLLLERLTETDPSRPFIQKIVSQADRSRNIIRGLLDFSRQRTPNRQPLDVNKVLQECVALVEDQASFHNIELVKDLRAGLPPVVIDPSQIQQVFINMMVNAADAMESGGRLALSTCLDSADGFVDVAFADTGHGISKENMERIFDPFFTTKETGHGVGLGLAISYGIIKEHQGTISVQSEVGKGTTFTISLPVARARAESAQVGKQDSHH